MTISDPSSACALCGYRPAPPPCPVCGGAATELGGRAKLRHGRTWAVVDLFRGIDDVRRAVFALLFERSYIGRLRWPVLANLMGFSALLGAGWFWLLPAFQSWLRATHTGTAFDGAHAWLIATWLVLGPPALDLLTGFAQEPIRQATEQHMLRASVATRVPARARARERLQMLLLGCALEPFALALALIPWAGLPLTLLLGAAVAGVVWMQQPMIVRGARLRERAALLRRNPWRTLGVGMGLQLAAAVPFLNALGLAPIATIAATSSFLHFDKEPLRRKLTPPVR